MSLDRLVIIKGLAILDAVHNNNKNYILLPFTVSEADIQS